MKGFYRVCAGAGVVAVLLFVLANWVLLRSPETTSGSPYRVEIHRLALVIEEQGLGAVDLSNCEYVTGVTEIQADAAGLSGTDSDYLVREIHGALYRFDYTQSPVGADSGVIVIINSILAAMCAVVAGVLVWVRRKILHPFEQLSEMPEKLAKGNLTVPLKESKNRFFGRFVWGMDMLRAVMERQKKREYELQREKNTLLLSLSHDMKTPLSAIKLYAAALSKDLYTDKNKQHEIAKRLNARADEMENYVVQLIQASEQDFFALEVQEGAFYLSALMERICADYAEKLALLQTEFAVAAVANCLLCGDFDRSVEVLQNILENAVKYGDGKHIHIGFGEEDDCVLIGVENSGCTLPNTELPHIFDRFWRGSNAGTVPGSGLGLAICRHLMHKMNGEVFAEVREGNMTVTAVFCKA